MIFKGQVFTLPANVRQYVHLGMIDDGQTVVFIDKYAKTALPQTEPADLLGSATRVEIPGEQEKLTVASQHATEASKESRDKRWKAIKDIVDNPALYAEGPRWALVSAHAKKMACSPITILTALRLYWQGGLNKDALLGYRVTSPRKDASKDAVCKRGRHATKAGSKNYHASKIDHENFKEIIESKYLKDARMTIEAAYQKVLDKHYFWIDGEGNAHLNAPGERPTLKQFTYYLKKNYTVAHRARARKGKKFNLEDRAVLGTVNATCDRPGQTYELDSTIADVTIVSSIRRADIIGRPTVYIVIDRKSRLVAGWYVGLEMPSWDCALQAIFSVAEDKEKLCRRLGIEYRPEDWPAVGVLCEQLLVDRGEGKSRRADLLGEHFDVKVTNLPALRPDWKPIVEGQFKLTHQKIADLPGYNPASNALQRRSVNYGDKAALTLDEFEVIMVRWFIAHNRAVMRSYELTRAQIRDRVEPSPVNLFRHGVRTQSGQMRTYTENVLRLRLLPSAEATIDEKGIWVNDMCYQPSEGQHPEWFVNGRRAVGAVGVSFDQRRVDMVYVHDKDAPGGYFTATLAGHSVKYAGLSLAEAKRMKKEEEELHANAEHSQRSESFHARRATKPVVENAVRETKSESKGVSKSARRAQTVATREAELARERDRTLAGNGADGAPVQPVAGESDVPAPPASNITYLSEQAAKRAPQSPARAARTQLFEGMSL